MNIENLQKYLGMAVHFVYYHQYRLHEDNVFFQDYCDYLKATGEESYWKEMHKCLEYALSTEDYCLSLIDSPMKQRFSEADIRLFFEKFYIYLGDCYRKG